MEIKSNQLLLNDVIYYTGNQYDTKHEVTKITIYKLYIDKDYIKINACCERSKEQQIASQKLKEAVFWLTYASDVEEE